MHSAAPTLQLQIIEDLTQDHNYRLYTVIVEEENHLKSNHTWVHCYILIQQMYLSWTREGKPENHVIRLYEQGICSVTSDGNSIHVFNS